jgi:hypothetical protein
VSRRIAVTLVHGVEISDPDFAVKPIERLKRAFARHSGGVDPDEALVVRATDWAPRPTAGTPPRGVSWTPSPAHSCGCTGR